MSVESVCHPTISLSVILFSSCLQSFPASGSFPISWLFASGGPGIAASAPILPMNEYSWLISFRIDWFDLLAVQGTLKSLPQHHSSPQKHQFFSAQPSIWWALTSIHDYWKNHSLDYTDLCQQSNISAFMLLILSRFVVAFLSRSERLLILWLHSPSVVILEPKKIVCHCFHCFPHLFAMQ